MKNAWLVGAILALAVAPWCAKYAWALAYSVEGNEEQSEKNYELWPGIMPLVNDATRVHLWWVNGSEYLYYRSTTKQINKALAAFAKVDVKNHIVALRPGPLKHTTRKGTKVDVTWSLHVVGGIALERAKDDLEDLDWQKDPVLTIYVGGDIDAEKLEIPPGMVVRSFLPKDLKETKRNAAG